MSIDNATPKKENKSFSIEDFNEIDQCKDAEEMEFLDYKGSTTGVVAMVLGSKSPIVTKWRNKKLNAQRRFEAREKKKGKNGEEKSIEEDLEFGVEFVSIRVVGWTGISEPYTPQTALHFCTVNDGFREQVMEFSEDLGNFGKSSYIRCSTTRTIILK